MCQLSRPDQEVDDIADVREENNGEIGQSECVVALQGKDRAEDRDAKSDPAADVFFTWQGIGLAEAGDVADEVDRGHHDDGQEWILEKPPDSYGDEGECQDVAVTPGDVLPTIPERQPEDHKYQAGSNGGRYGSNSRPSNPHPGGGDALRDRPNKPGIGMRPYFPRHRVPEIGKETG